MMNITDELLNKYLDGELNNQETAEVNSALSTSEEFRKRYNALRLVHDKLSKMEVEQVSSGFTSKLMGRLPHRVTVPRSQKYFIASISFVIVVICLGIIAYLTSIVAASIPEQSSSTGALNNLDNFIAVFISAMEKLFRGKNLSIIGSVFSFGILISGYFFFEYQKKAKANLSR